MNTNRIIRIKEIATTPTKTGILPVSRATIYRWVHAGKFPKPFKLSAGVTAWYAADVEQFIATTSGVAA